jgi:hypothetical protein
MMWTRPLFLAVACLVIVTARPSRGQLTLIGPNAPSPGSRLSTANPPLVAGDQIIFVNDAPATPPHAPPAQAGPITSGPQLQAEFAKRGDTAILVYKAGGVGIPRISTVHPAPPGAPPLINPSSTPSSPFIPPGPLGPVSYEVAIRTGKTTLSPTAGLARLGDGPGTDSNVTITIHCQNGNVAAGTFAGARDATIPGIDMFERDQTDIFGRAPLPAITGPDLGPVVGVTLQRDSLNPESMDWQVAGLRTIRTVGGIREAAKLSAVSRWLSNNSPMFFPLP